MNTITIQNLEESTKNRYPIKLGMDSKSVNGIWRPVPIYMTDANNNVLFFSAKQVTAQIKRLIKDRRRRFQLASFQSIVTIKLIGGSWSYSHEVGSKVK